MGTNPAVTGGKCTIQYHSDHSVVKSSQVVGLRDRVAIIRALLHAISFPHPYAGYGDLNGVGR